MVHSQNNSRPCSSEERCDSYGHGPKMKAQKIPPMTNEDDLPLVTVTHVESPSLFFVYFNVSDYSLDKELNIFMPQYKSMFDFGDEPPALMTRCVCSYSTDGNWYRAVVVGTSVSEEHSLLIKVYFCDYGNTENIPWEEGRIYRMPNYFATKVPMQAIPCALYGIQPADSSGWSTQEIDDFFTRLSDFTNDFQAFVKCRFYLTPRIEGAVAFVNLLLPETDGSFREQVTDIGRRWSISSNHFDLQSICSSLPDFLFSLLPVRLPEDKTVFVKPSEVVRLKSQVSRIDKDAAKQFIHRHLGIGENDDASRERRQSSIRSSQLNKDAAKKMITRHLGIDGGSRRSSSRSSGLPRPRGCVNSRGSGDSKRMTDRDEEEDDNNDEQEEAGCSGMCSPITTVACRPPKPCTDFPYGSVRIRSLLANIPDLVLRCTNDRVFHVIVSCVESPDRFFVNICSTETSELMSWLEEAMHHHYCDYYQGMMKQFLDENWSPVEGDVVCAESAANFFGRAIVEQVTRKKKTGMTARLFFIDYGFTETDVPLAKIHILSPEYFFRVPAQAMLCSLGINGSWGPEDREKIIQACGQPDRHGAISGLAMFIPEAQDHWDAELKEPVPVLLSRIADDFLINAVFDKCEVESNLGADVGSSPGEQSCRAMSESSGIDADWNVTDAIFQQSLNKQADLRRSGTSVQVCQFYKVRGRCMWGDKCRMYHTREDYEDDRINLEFELNVSKTEEVSYLDTGNLMNYPRKGAWVGIVVTVIFQPNRFCAQLLHGPGDYRFPLDEAGDSPEKTLAQLRNSMNRFYNDELPPDLKNKIYAPTELVAVRCSDNNWYRAAVLDHDSDRDDVVVKLLDTGDVQCIRQSWVLPLHLHFLTELPVQAFECFLKGVKRPHMGWSKQAWKFVVENMEGRPLHARVDDVSPTGILSLTLWNAHNRSTKDYMCINDYLKENELAISDEVATVGPWICTDDPEFVLYPG